MLLLKEKILSNIKNNIRDSNTIWN
jgi:hypothetical protein